MSSLSTFEILSIIFAISTAVFAVIGWLFNRLINQHRDFAKEKNKLEDEVEKQKQKVEDSEITKLVIQIKNLVDQIKFLFDSRTEQESDIGELNLRVGKVEKRIGEHFIRCNEREKLILNIKDRQDTSIAKFDRALVDRAGDPKRQDRCDRDS